MKVLKMVPVDNKYMDDHFTNELTDFLDEHMINEVHKDYLGVGNYCMELDEKHIAIRYPGATRGGIEVDENNVVVNVRLYNMTGGVAYGGKIYKDGTDQEILKFIGYKVEWPAEG